MSRWRRVVFTVGMLLIMLMVSALCWSAAYFITFRIYASLGKQPSDFARYLINWLLGHFLFGSIMLLFGQSIRPKQAALLKAMIDAMRRIAKGDFNVSLEVKSKHGGPFGEIVESINHMAVELNQMEQMRQEFISNVSHEIQSPLTSISGFARALQRDGLSREERLHYLGIIETESARLSKLSENLLKLTSLESEHHPFDPKRYRLDKQLRSIVLACEPQWREKAIEMDVCLDEVSVVADEDLLSQVWVNLINNSLKFTPSGGTIGIELKQRDRRAVVRISDTGIGIAEEDQPHIFERFYKADKSRNRTSGGNGLGLAIVKKIVDMHQGEIRVQSKLGEGAAFTVALPIDVDPPKSSHGKPLMSAVRKGGSATP